MKSVDVAIALGMIGISAVATLATADLDYWTDYSPGPSFAVRWASAVGAVIGLILLVQALRSRASRALDWPDRSGRVRVVAGVLALIGFLAVVPVLGTVVTATIFMLVLLILVQRQKVIPSLITTAITVGTIELVFDVWLNIAMPKGFLGI